MLIYCRGLWSMTTPFRWRAGKTVRRGREPERFKVFSFGRTRVDRIPTARNRNRRTRDSRQVEASTQRVEGQRRGNGENEVNSRDQVDKKTSNTKRRRESEACWGHGRSVCVFANLVVIGHGRVETSYGRGVERGGDED